MGYCGLDSFCESDTASDMAYDVVDKMVKILKKELPKKTNELNTDGVINVALFFEAFICPIKEYGVYDEITKLANDTIERLDVEIERCGKEEWDTESNRKWHMSSFKRMKRSLERFVRDAG